MSRTMTSQLIICLGLYVVLTTGTLSAQDRYYPLDHRAPTGVAGRWSAATRPGLAGAPQAVQVQLPSQGNVTFYAGSPSSEVNLAAPAQVGMCVGYVYRFCVSEMPDYPGIELYPTLELIDRLNPPQGLAQEFPIPVELTAEEIEIVLQDRMVTKVIYLEHPDLAYPVEQTAGIRIEKLSPSENLLQAADLRGRPVAILRVGGRIPDPRSPRDEFFSQSPLLLNSQ